MPDGVSVLRINKSFEPDIGEIGRYMGAKETDEKVRKLISEVYGEVAASLDAKVCFIISDISKTGTALSIGDLKTESKALSKNLSGCERAVLFCATVGTGIERVISKYSHISPLKAVCADACASMLIERICDEFENIIKEQTNKQLKPRFSPGYGDLPLEMQRDIFSVLSCNKNIGVFLTDSIMMVPSKSVSAFIGIKESEEDC